MASKTDTKEDFVRVALHVHTPASSGYNRDTGDTNDQEYYDILQNAKSKEIRIIAVTDHNTIEGYKKINSLKDKLLLEQQSLSTITDSQQANKRLAEIKTRLSLFEGVLVLPGVELTVRPGIHILLIFNTSVNPQSIEQFLSDAGHKPENLAKTESPILPSWDIVTLLEKTTTHDCILIDAHTDSDKGIWQELKGAERIHCFRSEQLSGVCYKSETQRDNIVRLLSTPQYKRTRPLAFLKCSDAHVPSDVGNVFTWAKLEDPSFQSLRKAFLNPLESFFTEQPSTTKILNNLTELNNSFGITKLESEDDIRYFLKLTCALNNSAGGYILLGLTENKSKVGISPSANNTIVTEISHIIDTAFPHLRKLEPFFSVDIPQVKHYELQNRRFILSLYFTKGTSLVNIEGDPSIYSIRKSKIVTLSASEIESLVQENVLKDVQANIVNRLQAVEADCLQIKNLTVSLPVLRKFEMNSFKIRATPVIPEPVTLNDSQLQRLLKFPHIIGCARGNLFYIQDTTPARLDRAYSRHTLPLWLVQHPVPKAKLKETIYIVPQGAIYYSKYDYPFYCKIARHPLMKLTPDTLTSFYGMRFLVAFLKSSFCLWYLLNRHGTTDFTDPSVFSTLRLPIITLNRPDSQEQITLINDTFDHIIREEHKFIAEFNKSYVRKNTHVQVEFVNNYNARIAGHFYAIDQAIYRLLGLSDDEIDVVENNLRFNKLYLPTNTDANIGPLPLTS